MSTAEQPLLSQTRKLTALHQKPKQMVEHIIKLVGYRDYYKETHFSGSYIEVWRIVEADGVGVYKVSLTERNRDLSTSVTYANIWLVGNNVYVVSYGHNTTYETSSNNLQLQKKHSELFTVLMNDIKAMFFMEFRAKHINKLNHAKTKN